MASYIFGTTGAMHTPDESGTNRTVYAQVSIGGSTPNVYPITGTMGGQQLFRVQYDIAANGTKYILTAGRGKGAVTFTIFEGPFKCGAEKLSNFASQYSSMDKHATRTIRILLPLKHTAQGSTQSTKDSAVFSGVIISADTTEQMDEDSGEIYVKTKVLAEGMWGE